MVTHLASQQAARRGIRQTLSAVDVPSLLASLSRRLPNLRAKTTVGWKLMERLDHQGRLTGEWSLQLADGTRLALPRQSSMSWTVAFRGSYDAANRAVLLPHVKPETLALDIGASMGLWTVALARAVEGRGAHVWAFEPHPNNHGWLHRNIGLNHLEDVVTVHETALGDTAGVVVMDAGAAGRNGGNAVIVGEGQGDVSVPVVTLDSIERPARVSAIKIDAEGYDIRILRGASRLIEQDRPVILGEFNAFWLRQRGDDLTGFLDEMRDGGYEVLAVNQLRTRPWLAADEARLNALPRGQVAEDLLLRPVA